MAGVAVSPRLADPARDERLSREPTGFRTVRAIPTRGSAGAQPPFAESENNPVHFVAEMRHPRIVVWPRVHVP